VFDYFLYNTKFDQLIKFHDNYCTDAIVAKYILDMQRDLEDEVRGRLPINQFDSWKLYRDLSTRYDPDYEAGTESIPFMELLAEGHSEIIAWACANNSDVVE
jgi:hypothetical protein